MADNEQIPEDLTVRGAIRAAIEEVGERQPPDPEPQEPEPQPEPETDEAKAERARDEQGRFTEQTKEKDQKKRETLHLPKKANAQGQPAEQPQGQAVKPPDSWTAEAKAQFGALPAVIQKEVLRREHEMHQGMTRQDEERSFGKKIKEIVTPYMPTITAEGSTPEQAVAALLNMAHIMRFGTPQQKQQLLFDTARLYNVPLSALPAAQPANPEVETLKQRLDRIEQERQAQELQRRQQEDFSLQTEIEAFASAPGHEHYEAVKPTMASFLASGQAQTLQEAYDKAIWASPDIRSTLLAQEEAKRLATQKLKTDAARRASVSVTGAPGPIQGINGAADPNRSLRDELRANLRAAQGRV